MCAFGRRSVRLNSPGVSGMGFNRVTQHELQREANSWVGRFKARGLDVPRRVTVYTDLQEFDRGCGIKRWERGRIMDEIGRLFLNGDANVTRFDRPRGPAIYVNTNQRQTGKDPRQIVIHEVLHHARPWLPHWKIRALERELFRGGSGRLIWAARTRTEYRRRRRTGRSLNAST